MIALKCRRRASRLRQYRIDPRIHVLADEHRLVSAEALFSVQAASGHRYRRERCGRDYGAGPVFPCDALPVMARRAA